MGSCAASSPSEPCDMRRASSGLTCEKKREADSCEDVVCGRKAISSSAHINSATAEAAAKRRRREEAVGCEAVDASMAAGGKARSSW